MVKYKEIANTIKQRIIDGTYEAGKPFPDQHGLAEEFETSRMTIQKALEILRYEGFIYSVRGSGTFVKKNADTLSKLDSKADEYIGLTKQMVGMGTVTSKVLSFTIRFPNEIECESLQILPSQPVYDIHRLRFLNADPLLLEHTVMPIHVIPGITEEVLAGSIYDYIETRLKLGIGAANRMIGADKPNEDDQEYLGCQMDDPVLEVDQVVFLDNGIAFEYSQTRRRYDKGHIVMVNLNKKKDR